MREPLHCSVCAPDCTRGIQLQNLPKQVAEAKAPSVGNFRMRSAILFAGLLYAQLGLASSGVKQNVAALHVCPVRHLVLKGGGASEELRSSTPAEGPRPPCSACARTDDAGRHMSVVAERRAERAERRAAELERRLEHLEQEFCVSEAALVGGPLLPHCYP